MSSPTPQSASTLSQDDLSFALLYAQHLGKRQMPGFTKNCPNPATAISQILAAIRSGVLITSGKSGALSYLRDEKGNPAAAIIATATDWEVDLFQRRRLFFPLLSEGFEWAAGSRRLKKKRAPSETIMAVRALIVQLLESTTHHNGTSQYSSEKAQSNSDITNPSAK